MIDIDGNQGPFPLSHIDILERWRELGFAQLPTEIRRTSQGRFHVIVKIKPARAFSDKINFWKKCAKGLHLGYKDLGADETATTNPVGLVRIPGNPNCKYFDKPIVETTFESHSVFTLSEIHQTQIDNGLLQPAIDRNKSIDEKITILENGVPPGIGNNACFTLAIYYRDQGIPEDEALEMLYQWNQELTSPDPPYKVRNSVKSAYRNGYGLSMKALNKWASIALGWQKSPTISREAKPVKNKVERNRIQGYADKISSFLEASGGHIVISQRALARSLDIPFRSFSHALKRIHGISLKSHGKGRKAKTEFRLRKVIPHLKLVHPKTDEFPSEMDYLNDANK